MDHRGKTHHAPTRRTPSPGGPNPAGRRHDTHPTIMRDQQWRQELQDHHDDAAVRELGNVVLGSVGTRPLLTRPLIWQSAGQESQAAWHALAVTDHFVVKVDLTITEAETMTTFTSVVRFIEHADVGAMPPEVEGRVGPRFGGADLTVPLPGTTSSQPPPEVPPSSTPAKGIQHDDAGASPAPTRAGPQS